MISTTPTTSAHSLIEELPDCIQELILDKIKDLSYIEKVDLVRTLELEEEIERMAEDTNSESIRCIPFISL